MSLFFSFWRVWDMRSRSKIYFFVFILLKNYTRKLDLVRVHIFHNILVSFNDRKNFSCTLLIRPWIESNFFQTLKDTSRNILFFDNVALPSMIFQWVKQTPVKETFTTVMQSWRRLYGKFFSTQDDYVEKWR